jgi:hypothetical protein
MRRCRLITPEGVTLNSLATSKNLVFNVFMFRQKHASAYYVAAVYVGLGDKEQALTLLEQHKEPITSILLKVDVYFDSLHQEPRFIKLLQQK